MQPSVYVAPTASLAYLALDDGPPVLTWQVSLANSGILTATDGYVNATTGALMAVNWTSFGADCASWDPNREPAVRTPANWNVVTRYNGTQVISGTTWSSAVSGGGGSGATDAGGSEGTSGSASVGGSGGNAPTGGTTGAASVYHQLLTNWQGNGASDQAWVSVFSGPWGEFRDRSGSPHPPIYCGDIEANDDDTLYWSNNQSSEDARDAASVLWAIQSADSYFRNFTFAGAADPAPVTWCGITGMFCAARGGGRAALDVVLNQQEITCSGRPCAPLLARYATNNGPLIDPTVFIDLRDPRFQHPVWLDTIAHEFAHGVHQAARARLSDSGNARFVIAGESAIILEGFADTFGELVEEYTLGTAPDYKATPLGIRNFQTPADSTTLTATGTTPQPKPDTYRVSPWVDPPTEVTTWDPYIDTTILTHWYYLLANGGEGTNGHSCPYHVDAVPSIDIGRVLFAALATYNGNNPTFHGLREETFAAAAALQPESDLSYQVARAWDAVGVTVETLPEDLIPALGDEVDPWPSVEVSWPAPPGMTWELQIVAVERDEVPDWSQKLWQGGLGPTQSDDGPEYRVHAQVVLDAGTTYAWRATPEVLVNQYCEPGVECNTEYVWGDCAVEGTFSTSPKLPRVLSPEPDRNGVYEFPTYDGDMSFGPIDGADTIRFSTRLTCDQLVTPGHGGVDSHGDPGRVAVGNESSEIALVGTLFVDDGDLISSDEDLPRFVPGQEYDLAVVPFSGPSRGSCETFRVRWPEDAAPTILYPGDIACSGEYGETDLKKVGEDEFGEDVFEHTLAYYASGVFAVFEWVPVEGATNYTLHIMEDTLYDDDVPPIELFVPLGPGQYARCGDLEEADGIQHNPNNLCYFGPPTIAEDLPWGFYRWRIEADLDGEYYTTSPRLCFWAGPSQPTIVEPEPDTTIHRSTMALRFSCAHANSYDVALKNSSGDEFRKIIPNKAEHNVVQEVTVVGLAADETYELTMTPRPWTADAGPEFAYEDKDHVIVAAVEFNTAENLLDVDDDGDGFSEDDGDCDDEDSEINPDEIDGCQQVGVDEDCDGEIDEDEAEGYCTDDDDDGQSEYEGDCDDDNPHAYEGADEPCGGDEDLDCDGSAPRGCIAVYVLNHGTWINNFSCSTFEGHGDYRTEGQGRFEVVIGLEDGSGTIEFDGIGFWKADWQYDNAPPSHEEGGPFDLAESGTVTVTDNGDGVEGEFAGAYVAGHFLENDQLSLSIDDFQFWGIGLDWECHIATQTRVYLSRDE